MIASSTLSAPRMILKHLLRQVLMIAVCLLPILVDSSFGGETPSAPLLWRTAPPVNPPDQPLPPKKPSILRERDISFDERLVKTLKDAAARPLPPIAVEFFDAGRYEMDVISTLARNNDTSFIRGQLKPQDSGEFSLVLNGATVTGTVQLGRRVFKIESLGNGRHRLIEIDPEQESKE
jgi:hypothetical protein